MEEPTNEAVERRQRSLRACENCRALKARCLPSDEPGKCQKCLKLRKPCISREPQPRRRGPRQSRTRVAEMEKKLDSLVALLAEKTPGSAKISPGPISDAQPHINGSNTVAPEKGFSVALCAPFTADTPDESASRTTLTGSDRGSTVGISAQPTPLPEKRRESGILQKYILSKSLPNGIPSWTQANDMLSSFRRNMIPHFPFVVIPEHVTAEVLSEEKPFTFLVIMGSTCGMDRGLQNRLHDDIRNSLGSRVILQGEKSLDILQGTLIYLAWYIFYFHPRTQQLYQILQLAIGMTLDLGLNQRPGKIPMRRGGINLDQQHRNHFEPGSEDLWNSDARRAFIGCYFLSSTLSNAFNKPNNLKYTDYVDDCCQSLARQNKCKSDSYLQYLVQSQIIAEDVADFYRTEESKADSSFELEDLRLKLHLKSFRSRIDKWKESLPFDLRDYPVFLMTYEFISVAILEIGLYWDQATAELATGPCRTWEGQPGVPYTQPRSKMDETEPTPAPEPSIEAPTTLCHPSTARLDTLVHLLQSCRSFFDSFFVVPISEYRSLTTIEWLRLSYALIVFAKVSMPIPTFPDWDATSTRSNTKLEDYLEGLSVRMAHATNYVSGMGIKPGDADTFYHFRVIFEGMRSWYTSRNAAGPTGAAQVDAQQWASPRMARTDTNQEAMMGDGRAGDMGSASAMESPSAGRVPMWVDGMTPIDFSNMPANDEFWATFMTDWSNFPMEDI